MVEQLQKMATSASASARSPQEMPAALDTQKYVLTTSNLTKYSIILS